MECHRQWAFFWTVSLISIAGHAPEVEEGVAPEEPPCAWCEHMKWAAIAGIALGWPPILKKAWKALTNKFQDINMLMSLAVIGAICIDEYVEGAAIVFLFALSKWLEDCATEKARDAISAVLQLKPE